MVRPEEGSFDSIRRSCSPATVFSHGTTEAKPGSWRVDAECLVFPRRKTGQRDLAGFDASSSLAMNCDAGDQAENKDGARQPPPNSPGKRHLGCILRLSSRANEVPARSRFSGHLVPNISQSRQGRLGWKVHPGHGYSLGLQVIAVSQT